MRLYKRASHRGDGAAAYNLGYMYESGNGASVNYRVAIEYFKRAAQLGNKRSITFASIDSTLLSETHDKIFFLNVRSATYPCNIVFESFVF